ncbi:MAG TPA: neocarzinostatin apoprotein domain-containing protein [Candidatus Saccharimonadia bacterium]|nr:neocarzinostatin apoprotein domain-containing protein [Candidatus Saccharimonadia bacterium]
MIINKVLNRFLPVLVVLSVLAFLGIAKAAGVLNASPSSGLTNGQTISVSASGLADKATGAILECNSDANQPTVMAFGNTVPVGCSNPLPYVVTTDSSGNLAATPFVVHTGTVGPPAAGTDSSGGSATTDAANYPCPPTAAQIAAGDTCQITFGDASGDDVFQNVTFASSPTTPPPGPTSNNTKKTTTTLPNTGPGTNIGLFLLIAIVCSGLHYAYSFRRSAKSS